MVGQAAHYRPSAVGIEGDGCLRAATRAMAQEVDGALVCRGSR